MAMNRSHCPPIRKYLRCFTFVVGLLFDHSSMVMGQTYKPVSSLDTEAYLGRWYQVAANPLFILIELGGACVTADYELRESDGKIALINQSRPWLIPKIFARTTGFAVQSDDVNNQGSFTVDQGYLFALDPDKVEYEDPGNYWILGLGPKTNGQYQWAAISNEDKDVSFIIARDVDEFRKGSFEQEAKQIFEDFDFGYFSKPWDTIHTLCFGYGDGLI